MGGPAIPEWLLRLKSGSYTLTDFVKKSGGKSKTSIHRTLTRLKVDKIIGEKIYKNLVEVKYIWVNPIPAKNNTKKTT